MIGEVVDFNSSSKWPFCKFSNLFECPLEVEGVKYGSSEGAYQAQCACNSATREACAEGGAFATLDFLPEAKRAYWGKKKMVGIAAKMATTRFRDRKAKYCFAKEMLTYESARTIWTPILRAKFASGSELALLLQSTGNKLLLERARFGNSRWGGKVKDGEVLGHNWMGRLLMERRDALNE